MFWIFPDLAFIKPIQDAFHRGLVRFFLAQTGLYQCLADKRCVPELRPVGSRHHQTFIRHPKEIINLCTMLLERIRFRSFSVPSTDHVEHLGNGSDRLIARVLVLHNDQIVCAIDPELSERGEGTLFIDSKYLVQTI